MVFLKNKQKNPRRELRYKCFSVRSLTFVLLEIAYEMKQVGLKYRQNAQYIEK